MASITFKNRPTQVLHTYQVWRIGSNVDDKSLDFCTSDKSVKKYHASLTLGEKGLFLVNESRVGIVSVNGMRVGGPVQITCRDAINGVVKLRFGRIEGYLRVSCRMTG
ncbi:uncharacterized protein LOC108098158 [Drosophila ficusphila]|uniref:uncharacterized protein LOC108097898 n=1 Tax=Drosophila ficusphila TaxID=30025 RepID=UPI0007E71334|nr:uncharacterized protein LOC108097898 [Drosophila ficusphila]XP_017056383.1 uncharacterized protein LOC108098158 [Drosophila ficusphila]